MPSWIWFFVFLWITLLLFGDKGSCDCHKDEDEMERFWNGPASRRTPVDGERYTNN